MLLLLVAAVAVVVIVAGLGRPWDPRPEAAPSAPAAPGQEVDAAQALEVLDTLPVKGRAPATGYTRQEFGPTWPDVDGNGCSTRNDILARDLVDVQVSDDGCTVASGVLDDPYTGQTIDFTAGPATSGEVQVDHVVALSDAWQKGAQRLSPDERVAFANDPLNLLAVDGSTNQAKGDGDAATWLPPRRGAWCPYVARQVQVKARYDLWVTRAEHRRMEDVLTSCARGAERREADTGTGADGGPPRRGFATCAEARSHGYTDIRRGDPGYEPHLDGGPEGPDGVACES